MTGIEMVSAKSPRIYSSAIIAFFSAVLSVSGRSSDWAGEVVVQDGVKHVLNPSTPLNGRRNLELEELWRISEDSEEIVGLVVDVAESIDGDICLLDFQLKTVWVYGPDGRLIRSFGREGEGPGEFRQPLKVLQWPNDQLAVVESFPPRFHIFNANGDPCGTVPLRIEDEHDPHVSVSQQKAEAAGQSLVVETLRRSFIENKSQQSRCLSTANIEGTVTNTLLKRQWEHDLSMKMHRHEEDATWINERWAVGTEELIYVAVGHRGYAIDVFDLAGNHRMVIERQYESVTRTEDEKQEAARPYERISRYYPNLTYEISNYHMDIVGIHAMTNETIWVQSSQGKWRLPEGAIASYDVFSAEGQYLEQVTLFAPVDPVDDLIFLLDDLVLVVPDFWSLAYALGGHADLVEPDGSEPSGAMVVCYQFPGNSL